MTYSSFYRASRKVVGNNRKNLDETIFLTHLPTAGPRQEVPLDISPGHLEAPTVGAGQEVTLDTSPGHLEAPTVGAG